MAGKLGSTADALYRVKRGLAGYVSFLAACEMNQAFSEYLLYEPTLRILSSRGFIVNCEVPCPGFPRSGPGDQKRLDFVARNDSAHFALEMKWARTPRPNVRADLEKLRNYQAHFVEARVFLCVFGTRTNLSSLHLAIGNLEERGSPVYAQFGVTKFGCRVFELARTP